MDALIENLLNLIRSVPIIPLIIAFSLLRRFISKKPTASTDGEQPQNPPTTVTGSDDTWGTPYAPTFDDPGEQRARVDPSIDPVPTSTVFGGNYGETKYGFDESEWGSTFDSKARDEPDDTPRIHVG